MSKNSVINNEIGKISWFYRLNGNSLGVLFKIMKTIKIYTFVIIYIQTAPLLLRVIKNIWIITPGKLHNQNFLVLDA